MTDPIDPAAGLVTRITHTRTLHPQRSEHWQVAIRIAPTPAHDHGRDGERDAADFVATRASVTVIPGSRDTAVFLHDDELPLHTALVYDPALADLARRAVIASYPYIDIDAGGTILADTVATVLARRRRRDLTAAIDSIDRQLAADSSEIVLGRDQADAVAHELDGHGRP